MSQNYKHESSDGEERSQLTVPTDVMGNVAFDQPSEITQMIDDKPTTATASAFPVQKQLCYGNQSKAIRRAENVGIYFPNLPLIDEAVATKQLAKLLDYMAQNHQRQKLTAFWEDYPDAVVRAPMEAYPDRQTLRSDYQKYNMRGSNYLIRYYNWSIMLNGAVLNLMSAARLAGNQMFQTIASNTRWTWINGSIRQNLNLWPIAKGVPAVLMKAAKYLVGVTGYNSKYAIMPLFPTDIWGNRGFKSISPADFILQKSDMESVGANLADSTGATNDREIAFDLIKNMETIVQSCCETKRIRSFGGKLVDWYLRMPSPENGGAIYMEGDANHFTKYTVHHASDGKEFDGSGSGSMVTDDPLTSILWNNYFYLLDMGRTYFPDMMDPESDIRKLADSLGLFDKPLELEELWDAIRANKNIDAVEFFNTVKYRKSNRATTATVVRWVPPFGDPEASDEWSAIYERYDTTEKDITKYLMNCKRLPGFTPSIFSGIEPDGTSTTPFVINALPPVGSENMTLPRRAGMFGRDAVIFDHVCLRNTDDDKSFVEFNGVTAEWAKDYCVKQQGVVYHEDPTTIHILRLPCYDDTDPYQCGVMMMLDSEGFTKNEFNEFFVDPDHFVDVRESAANFDGPVLVYDNQEEYVHTASRHYLETRKYAFIFTGINGLQLPEFAMGKVRNTNLAYEAAIPVDLNYLQVEAGDGTPGGALATIISEAGNNGRGVVEATPEDFTPEKRLRIEYFDSTYGPVAISADDFTNYDEGFDFNTAANYNTQYEFKLKTVTSFHDYTTERSTFREYSKYSPYMKAVSFKGFEYDAESAQFFIPFRKDPPVVHFCDSGDYLRSQYLHTIVEHLGVEDTVPFWSGPNVSAILKSFESFNPIDSGLTMETNRLLMAVRMIKKFFNKNNRKPDQGKKWTASYIHNNASDNFGGVGKSNSDSGSNQKSRTNNGKSNSAKRNDFNLSDEKKGKINDDKASDLTFQDASSEKADKDFDKQKKIPADPLSSMVGV